jgi:hypothetical protein
VIKKYLLDQPLPKKAQNLKTCLNILDQLSETVCKICDLLITVTKQNRPIWHCEILDTLFKEIYNCIQFLIGILVQDNNRCTKKLQGEERQTCVGEYDELSASISSLCFPTVVPRYEIFLRKHFKDLQHHPAVDQSSHRLPNDRVYDG